jgi:hypothetical protein
MLPILVIRHFSPPFMGGSGSYIKLIVYHITDVNVVAFFSVVGFHQSKPPLSYNLGIPALDQTFVPPLLSCNIASSSNWLLS